MTNSSKENILIIKFGGLGDFILSLTAMNSIKKFHPDSRLVLLTEEPYDVLAKKSNWFDEIVTIKRSIFYFLDKIDIKKKINNLSIEYVYDLQTSKRSSSYIEIFKNPKIKWSGIVKDNSYYHDNSDRNKMHTLKRQENQLNFANIKNFENYNKKWLFRESFSHKFSKKKYIIMIVGGSSKRKYKRVPEVVFIKIAQELEKKKIYTILVGGKDEQELCNRVKSKCPNILNLCNETSFFGLAYLAKNCLGIIGNDTGPMHLCALSDKKTIVFFTKFSNPELCAPIGKHVEIINFYGNIEETISKALCKINT
jgi:ADP-heptose:LPS heptosyltransferase